MNTFSNDQEEQLSKITAISYVKNLLEYMGEMEISRISEKMWMKIKLKETEYIAFTYDTISISNQKKDSIPKRNRNNYPVHRGFPTFIMGEG